MNDAEQEAILQALEAQGINRSLISSKYSNTTVKKHGYAVAAPNKNEDEELAKITYTNYLNDQMTTINDKAFENSTAQDMLNRMIDPKTSTRAPYTIEEIEGNTTLFGIAHALLKNELRLTPTQRGSSIMTYLKGHATRLGFGTADDVLTNPAKSTAILGSHTTTDIAPLFAPGKITSRSWATHTKDQRDAIIRCLTDPTAAPDFRAELRTYAMNQLTPILTGKTATQTRQIEDLVKNSLDMADITKTPEPITAGKMLAAADNDAALAAEALGELRVFNIGLGNIKAFIDGKII
jgi:hypothetical protein